MTYCSAKVEHTSDGYCSRLNYRQHGLCHHHLIETTLEIIKIQSVVIEFTRQCVGNDLKYSDCILKAREAHKKVAELMKGVSNV